MLKLSIHLVDQNHLGLKIKQVLSQSCNTLLLKELEIKGEIGEREEKEGKKEGMEEGREKEEMEGK